MFWTADTHGRHGTLVAARQRAMKSSETRWISHTPDATNDSGVVLGRVDTNESLWSLLEANTVVLEPVDLALEPAAPCPSRRSPSGAEASSCSYPPPWRLLPPPQPAGHCREDQHHPGPPESADRAARFGTRAASRSVSTTLSTRSSRAGALAPPARRPRPRAPSTRSFTGRPSRVARHPSPSSSRRERARSHSFHSCPQPRRSASGRTSLYGLLNAGELETVAIGSRCVVVAESLRAYVDRLREPAEPTLGVTANVNDGPRMGRRLRIHLDFSLQRRD